MQQVLINGSLSLLFVFVLVSTTLSAVLTFLTIGVSMLAYLNNDRDVLKWSVPLMCLSPIYFVIMSGLLTTYGPRDERRVRIVNESYQQEQPDAARNRDR